MDVVTKALRGQKWVQVVNDLLDELFPGYVGNRLLDEVAISTPCAGLNAAGMALDGKNCLLHHGQLEHSI